MEENEESVSIKNIQETIIISFPKRSSHTRVLYKKIDKSKIEYFINML